MVNYLQAAGISRRIGDIILFENLTFTAGSEERIGIVAVNGAGKSSLLDVLAGREQPDSGTITRRRGITTGYLRQLPDLNDTSSVFDEVFYSDTPALSLIRQYEEAVASDDTDALATLVQAMDDNKAWDYEVRVKQILSILSIPDPNATISTLSGGQKKRVALAKVLIEDPDLLILDEPTNHLDVEMAEWLEEYLIKAGKAVILVTHDRYFLDNVCTVIYELSGGELMRYDGNYGYFLDKRDERLANERASAEKARNLLRTELDWIRRMPKARSHKAKYRIDAFQELKEKAVGPANQKNVNINISTARLGSKILSLDSVTKSYSERNLITDFSYTFGKGIKIGVVGANGSGKSTLLNIITGSLLPDSGSVEKGETVVFGYYRQEGIVFDEEQTVIKAVTKIAETSMAADGRELSVGSFLTRFLFPPSRQHTLIRKLSGGEKRRLYLLTVLLQNPNFIVLDEPTNDLDILTLNVLEEYLISFTGCVVVVTHDRYFLDKIADFIFEVKDGRVRVFTGNYTMLREELALEELKNARKIPSAAATEKVQSNIIKQPQQSKKGLTYSEKREFETLSKELETLASERTDLEEKLSGSVTDLKQIEMLSSRLGIIINLIDEKELRWLELSEKA
ncbi:MAG TPA: ABC-F family ATP-binding cassette domain-containing protein [Bacteroidales bacterium]|nr:ABC-F family ATP-binding cassette domain-containing protein [Bacteroidales bacterium]HPT11848.1 ABC-F family ATP-binding cassette domain-containing protein [Bacteroidales bacterium]